MSPHLFSIVANDVGGDLPKDLPRSLYADDFSLRAANRRLFLAVEHLNLGLRRVKNYADVWGIQFDPDKSQIMTFCHQKTYSCAEADDIRVTYGNTRIPTTRRHRFLGLTLSYNMDWSAHINQVARACHFSLGLLRSVAHAHWGNDFSALRILYLSLIRSIIDYALPVYGNVGESKFHKLNVIQAAALRVILGVPKSTPNAACQILANVPPLALRQESATAKFTARRHAFDALERARTSELLVSIPIWRPRPPSTVQGTNFFSNHGYPALLDDIDPTPRFPSLLPPDANLAFEIAWCQSAKHEVSNDALKLLFLQRLDDINAARNPVYYTDGSHDPVTLENGAGIYCQSPELVSSFRLQTGLSIMTVELHAIAVALIKAKEAAQQTVIVASDSLAAIQTIKAGNTAYRDVRQIYNLSSHLEITIIWTPAHVGIAGNERADSLAKAALGNAALPLEGGFPLPDAKSLINRLTTSGWRNAWRDDNTGRLLHSVHGAPTTKLPHWSLKRQLFSSVNRLLTNRAGFKSFLFLIQKIDSPDCDTCHVPETSEHFLLTCCRFDEQRQDLISAAQKLKIPFTFSSILGGGQNSPISKNQTFAALQTFIETTVGYEVILGRSI